MKILAVAVRPIMFVLFTLFACYAFEANAQAQASKETLQIKSIQARLFLMREGKFGDDLINPDRANIVWNVGVNALSDTFLVIVEVTGPAEHREPLPTLVLTAETIRKVFFRRTARVFTAIDGKYYAAFLVPTSGCAPIKVTARIPGQRKPATRSQLINFQCGE